MVVDQFRDALGGRVHINHHHRLALAAQFGKDRVVAVQDHLVVERLIDPRADDLLDLGEIDHHAERIERGRLDRDDRLAVVPVQVLALAGVVEEPVAVAEEDFLGHAEHGPSA